MGVRELRREGDKVVGETSMSLYLGEVLFVLGRVFFFIKNKFIF